jgi:glycosyltransferase involved in cell wall biosynthesis
MATSPVRVLHVNTEKGWRGGERQTLWLAMWLARMGHFSIVACRPGEPLAKRALEERLHVVSTTPIGELDLAAAFRLRAYIRKENIQIVHAHTAHAVALAAFATMGTSAAMVTTRRVDFRLRPNLASRWKYGRARAIIAISKAVADALVASGIARDRIEVIPSGVDLSRTFVPATAETLALLGVPARAPLVVQVSQLVPHKDPVTFVRAIAEARRRVPGLHALLVGDGQLRADVESAILESGVGDILHLTGYRRDADSLLMAADVVTLSSKEEGLGTVLLDAMSMGKPIAAPAAGGIPEIVEHEKSGLVSSVGDAKRLGENIASLLTNKVLASRLSAGARERVKEFSVQRTSDRTLEVYRRLLAEKA